MVTAKDIKEATTAIEGGPALYGIFCLVASLDVFVADNGYAGNPEPEQAALARKLSNDLTDLRTRYLARDVPGLAARIAAREAQVRAELEADIAADAA